MNQQTHYYLIKGEIKMATSKMPKEPNFIGCNRFYAESLRFKYSDEYSLWLNSLQPCSITENELCLILSNVSKLDYDNPIEVTDIITDNEISCCKKCDKTAEACNCSFNSDSHANRNTYLKSVIIFKQPKSEANEAVEFAEWLSQYEWIKRNHTHPKNVGKYWSVNMCEYKTIEQLYEIFKTLNNK